MKRCSIVTVILFLLLSLTIGNEVVRLKGKFVIVGGNRFRIVDLQQPNKILVHEFTRMGWGGGRVSAIDAKRAFFGTPWKGEIFMLDAERKSVQFQLKGSNPLYMKKHRQLVYYGADSEGKPSLLMSSPADNYAYVARISDSPQGDLDRAVQISEDEFVFERNLYHGFSNTKERQIWKYNIATQKTEKYRNLSDCRLTGIWRSQSKQLLCNAMNKRGGFIGKFFLTSLDGARREYLDVSRFTIPGVYLEFEDVMLYAKTRLAFFSETSDLWSYNFKTGKKTRLAKRVGFPAGAIVQLKDD